MVEYGYFRMVPGKQEKLSEHTQLFSVESVVCGIKETQSLMPPSPLRQRALLNTFFPPSSHDPEEIL